ncbi:MULTISPECIES: acyl-CoA dehydrogenase family protein [unclassified Halomonas]|uniref:acyl-CoA dehydrogenase family protein n=1 Tax=unclassified Halomonas TaxID=2609666 RepID=UPI00207687E7|nr:MULTISPECIES: acyl-CoA dehydrogenase family protein [unclassified Halomonas]
MSMDEDLRPEEFAEAASAAVGDVIGREFAEVASTLGGAGLLGVCAAEEDGGMGLPIAFAVPICQVAGRLRLRFPVVEQALVAKALAGTPQAAELINGERTATIAWHAEHQGMAGHAPYAADCDWILVPDGDGAALVARDAVTLTPHAELDPESPYYSVSLESAPILQRISVQRYQALREEAYLLTGAYLNGAAQGALEYTADYLAGRVQFGRPLTAKQAVRHHLARMKLLNEVSLCAIARAVETDEFDATRSYKTAWAGALTNALFVIEKAIHLNGGMGFTWEVPLHYALRDARRIEAALQGSATINAIGQNFIDAA